MLFQIAGAAAGAMAGNWVVEKFVFKQADGSGFIEVTDGFGLDDVVHWVVVGAGAYFGMKLLGKVGG
jgi:hypothetical protein